MTNKMKISTIKSFTIHYSADTYNCYQLQVQLTLALYIAIKCLCISLLSVSTLILNVFNIKVTKDMQAIQTKFNAADITCTILCQLLTGTILCDFCVLSHEVTKDSIM